MKCPRSRWPLEPLVTGGVTVDFCEACGGVFLDRARLQRCEGGAGPDGAQLARTMSDHSVPTMNLAPRIRCPRHPDVVMMRHFYSPKNGVEIDECPQCGGIWLDGGDLVKMRNEEPDAATRDADTRALVAQTLGAPIALQSDRDAERRRILARELREETRWLEGRRSTPADIAGDAIGFVLNLLL